MRATRWPAGLLLLPAITLAGCSASAGTPPSSTARGSGSLITNSTPVAGTPAATPNVACCLQLSVAVDFTGEVTVNGNFVHPYLVSKAAYATCTAWAVNGPGATGIPIGGPVNVGTLDGGIQVGTGYVGPGTYPLGHGSTVNPDFLLGTTEYRQGQGSKGTFTMGADGAGTFQFTNLRNTATGGAESGIVYWACS